MKKFDENGKYERKIIIWFMILTTRYESNPEATVWNDSEKFMSVKNHILKKHLLPNFTSGIRREFAEQREIGLFCLLAESRILQSYFCQQPH